MTANREQQRERLTELFHERFFMGTVSSVLLAQTIDYLLDHGVTVEVPETDHLGHALNVNRECEICSAKPTQPECQPGDVAIATVRGVEGMRVIRHPMGSGWVSVTEVEGRWFHLDREVTVTSRAVVVTEADRDELVEAAVDLMGITGSDSKLARTIREWFAARLEGGAS